jgi:elongation factor G
MPDAPSPRRSLLCARLVPEGGDIQRLLQALEEIARDDSTIVPGRGMDDGHVLLGFREESQLALICDRLDAQYQLVVIPVDRRVGYLETVRISTEAEGKFIRQTGNRGQYAHVKLRLDPNPGRGYEFVNQIVAGAVPPEYITPIDDGIRQAMEGGVLKGFPLAEVKVMLLDGSYHEGDSSPIAFTIAASMALKEAARRAMPVILEPIMDVEVVVPEELMRSIQADLTGRRGSLDEMEGRDGLQVIRATVPLAELMDYSDHLRAITAGNGRYSAQFSHYQEVSHGGSEPGDPTGVTANRPSGPSPKSGSVEKGPPDHPPGTQ